LNEDLNRVSAGVNRGVEITGVMVTAFIGQRDCVIGGSVTVAAVIFELLLRRIPYVTG